MVAPHSSKFWLLTPQPQVLDTTQPAAADVARALRRAPRPPRGLLQATRRANCDLYERLLALLCAGTGQGSDGR